MKVGIDLGTTYSTVAIYDKKASKSEVVNNSFGKELTPSVICFLDNDEILIGEDAKDMQAGGAGIIASAFKRGMGDNSFTVDVKGRIYTAEELSTMLLKRLISDAEAQLDEKIDSVVITVPAYFNDFQRTATIRAGEACGVKVMKIVNEPTAAAISYGYNHTTNKTIMVYDLGGGTFDVTIVRIDKGNIQVLGTDGNHILGGKDWDAVISKHICEQFEEEFGVDPRNDESAKNEIAVLVESYKRVLTKTDSATIPLKYDNNTGRYTMTREQFDMKTQFLLNATKDVCIKLMDDLGMTWADIDEILLVGGSTRMPQVSEFLAELTGKTVVAHADTDLAVAKGAAITAELYCSTSCSLRVGSIVDVTAHSLGALSVSIDGKRYVNEIMIKRNSKVPASVKKPFRITEGNMTDRIEVYTLQGESKVPLDCYVLAKVVITGFTNMGDGAVIDVEYTYDENGVVNIVAYQDGDMLQVDSEQVPDDISWMGEAPGSMPSSGKSQISKNIVICVDLSRSMKPSIDEVKDAIKDFISGVSDENTKFGLVGFGDKVRILRDLTSDTEVIKGSLEELKVNMLGRGTDGSPLGTAQSMLSGRSGAKMIVVLTDGIWGKRDFAVSEAMSCRSAKIATVAVGFGDADTSFLKQIATVEEGAMFTTLDRLGDTFSTIATAINTGSMGLREVKNDKARIGN